MNADDIDWDDLARDNDPDTIAAFKDLIDNTSDADTIAMAYGRLVGVELKVMAQFIENGNHPATAFVASVLMDAFKTLGGLAWKLAKEADYATTAAQLEAAVKLMGETSEAYLRSRGAPIIHRDIAEYLKEHHG